MLLIFLKGLWIAFLCINLLLLFPLENATIRFHLCFLQCNLQVRMLKGFQVMLRKYVVIQYMENTEGEASCMFQIKLLSLGELSWQEFCAYLEGYYPKTYHNPANKKWQTIWRAQVYTARQVTYWYTVEVNHYLAIRSPVNHFHRVLLLNFTAGCRFVGLSLPLSLLFYRYGSLGLRCSSSTVPEAGWEQDETLSAMI